MKNNAKLRGIDAHVVGLVRPDSFEAEQYRRLRQRIEDLRGTQAARVIAVTSPVQGDGKTLTAINLAATFARASGVTALLVDCDLRRPRMGQMLGLGRQMTGWPGLLERAERDLRQCARPLTAGLAVLCADHIRTNTYDLLRSARVAEVLAQARRLYDYVILDTPPTVPVPDSGLLSRVVDGYLIVVGANSTPRKLLAETLNLFQPESVIGLVFNRDDRPLFGYYGTHYQQYFDSYVRSIRRTTV